MRAWPVALVCLLPIVAGCVGDVVEPLPVQSTPVAPAADASPPPSDVEAPREEEPPACAMTLWGYGSPRPQSLPSWPETIGEGMSVEGLLGVPPGAGLIALGLQSDRGSRYLDDDDASGPRLYPVWLRWTPAGWEIVASIATSPLAGFMGDHDGVHNETLRLLERVYGPSEEWPALAERLSAAEASPGTDVAEPVPVPPRAVLDTASRGGSSSLSDPTSLVYSSSLGDFVIGLQLGYRSTSVPFEGGLITLRVPLDTTVRSLVIHVPGQPPVDPEEASELVGHVIETVLPRTSELGVDEVALSRFTWRLEGCAAHGGVYVDAPRARELCERSVRASVDAADAWSALSADGEDVPEGVPAPSFPGLLPGSVVGGIENRTGDLSLRATADRSEWRLVVEGDAGTDLRDAVLGFLAALGVGDEGSRAAVVEELESRRGASPGLERYTLLAPLPGAPGTEPLARLFASLDELGPMHAPLAPGRAILTFGSIQSDSIHDVHTPWSFELESPIRRVGWEVEDGYVSVIADSGGLVEVTAWEEAPGAWGPTDDDVLRFVSSAVVAKDIGIDAGDWATAGPSVSCGGWF